MCHPTPDPLARLRMLADACALLLLSTAVQSAVRVACEWRVSRRQPSFDRTNGAER